MKIELYPTAYHARRARRGCGTVIRCRQGVFDCYPKPDLPPSNTSEQLAVRAVGKATAEAWRALSPEQKAAWAGLGRKSEPIFPRRSVEPLTGYRLFQSCARYRQILGLAIHADPQGFAPPESVTGIELLPSADPRAFRFKVFHTAKAPGPYRLIVSLSPATGSRGRRADRHNGRHIKGFGPDSTAPLPASGGVVEFSEARFTIRPGERFGLWVRIVHEQTGSAGPEFFVDLERPTSPPEDGKGRLHGPGRRPEGLPRLGSADLSSGCRNSLRSPGWSETPSPFRSREGWRGRARVRSSPLPFFRARSGSPFPCWCRGSLTRPPESGPLRRGLRRRRHRSTPLPGLFEHIRQGSASGQTQQPLL